MQKENIKHTVFKLWQATETAFLLSKEVNALLKIYCESNRKFKRGEIVAVYKSRNDEKIGEAMVAECRTYIFLDAMFLKRYFIDPQKLENDIDEISYELFAIKKDGSASSKHLFDAPHFVSESKNYDYYIGKL